MAQTTKLDMDSVRDHVRREVQQLRDKGIPLTYVKDGKIVRERLLGKAAEKKKPVPAV